MAEPIWTIDVEDVQSLSEDTISRDLTDDELVKISGIIQQWCDKEVWDWLADKLINTFQAPEPEGE